MMLKRTGENQELVQHFLQHGSLHDVSEAQITMLVTALGIGKVQRYQEQRAATKSKLNLGYCSVLRKFCFTKTMLLCFV